MKVTIRRTCNRLSAYMPKLDLEEPILTMESEKMWGGIVLLASGMRLALPDLPQDTRLPVTVEAPRYRMEEQSVFQQRT
ncbi:putative nitrogen fixation protein NifT [Neorhizobium galegae]|uniref:Nitrogen fixation protein FixU n=2 Tax=Neorhizobium galegae bv. officinalis TaxID=323656 RepID=A0A0T7G7R3_NEOGA|nr:putative nitrogen fixation protein NifT [Neorhizobium galegae]KAA9382470.1 putative nitrogen fixation protein NifT [Neorhizobium galegae]KAB1110087.1 putative nitrogen fixation protein NifT [Neorhizobium galegae]MCM2501903.1 putative nitrogen fixation protein NifT [Neorhizobium galegae]MCQ1769606.1 putative nitrogen fixation protein NifT [Neorhizobium galegae]MCQ1775134.1 putative nitrogen fixation protein NifT [Neorhizobium galegae]